MLELGTEYVDRVGAIEAHVAPAEELVPELFQTNGGGNLSSLPQHPHHLTIGANAGVNSAGANTADRFSDDVLEPPLVRLSIHHEACQGSLCVEEHQPAFQDGSRVGC